MQKIIKSAGAALALAALISGCSKAPNLATKPYKNMTEAEQTVMMADFVEILERNINAKSHQMPGVVTTFRGDAKTDMVYTDSIYQHKVSAKDLRIIKPIIEKMQSKELDCTRPEIVKLTKLGIGFKVSMKDISGKVILDSKPCLGATS